MARCRGLRGVSTSRPAETMPSAPPLQMPLTAPPPVPPPAFVPPLEPLAGPWRMCWYSAMATPHEEAFKCILAAEMSVGTYDRPQ
eukprot:scaffold23982_cov79-Isochrysis_galbana.AAC.2